MSTDKKLDGFLCFLDIAIKHGREAGLSDEFLELGLRNRLGRGVGAPAAVAEPGSITARAREELGFKVRDYGDFKTARQRLGLNPAPGSETIQAVGSLLPGRKAWTVDADGKPVENQMQAWTKHLSETVAEMNRFQRLLVSGQIPPEEVEAARAGGVAAWRRLREKYGPKNPPVPDPGFGAGGAA